MEAGRAFALRPAGLLALDVARVEAGLILLEVDYTSARHALSPEQALLAVRDRPRAARRPRQAGPFVGRRGASRGSGRGGGPARRLVGLVLDWDGIERLQPRPRPASVVSAAVSRDQVPVFAPAAARSAGSRAAPGARRSRS